MIAIYRRLRGRADIDRGFEGLMGPYVRCPSERAQHIMRCLQDMNQLRLAHMGATGIDMQVMALTSPGAQVMGKAEAVSFSILANGCLAGAIRRHPTRLLA